MYNSFGWFFRVLFLPLAFLLHSHTAMSTGNEPPQVRTLHEADLALLDPLLCQLLKICCNRLLPAEERKKKMEAILMKASSEGGDLNQYREAGDLVTCETRKILKARYTLLYIAVRLNLIELIDVLLEVPNLDISRGVEVIEISREGQPFNIDVSEVAQIMNPLVGATRWGNCEVIKKLIDKKANVSQPIVSFALAMAVLSGHYDIVYYFCNTFVMDLNYNASNFGAKDIGLNIIAMAYVKMACIYGSEKEILHNPRNIAFQKMIMFFFEKYDINLNMPSCGYEDRLEYSVNMRFFFDALEPLCCPIEPLFVYRIISNECLFGLLYLTHQKKDYVKKFNAVYDVPKDQINTMCCNENECYMRCTKIRAAPLFVAAMHNSTFMSTYLLEHHANIQKGLFLENINGIASAFLGRERLKEEEIEALENTLTPLVIAVARGGLEVVQLLISAGALNNSTTYYVAIVVAAQYLRIDILNLLLNADVNLEKNLNREIKLISAPFGITSLAAAVSSKAEGCDSENYLKVIQLLISHGANMHYPSYMLTHHRMTPFDYMQVQKEKGGLQEKKQPQLQLEEAPTGKRRVLAGDDRENNTVVDQVMAMMNAINGGSLSVMGESKL